MSICTLDIGGAHDEVISTIRWYLSDNYGTISRKCVDYVVTVILELMMTEGSILSKVHDASILIKNNALNNVEAYVINAILMEVLESNDFLTIRDNLKGLLRSYGGVASLIDYEIFINNRYIKLEFKNA